MFLLSFVTNVYVEMPCARRASTTLSNTSQEVSMSKKFDEGAHRLGYAGICALVSSS